MYFPGPVAPFVSNVNRGANVYGALHCHARICRVESFWLDVPRLDHLDRSLEELGIEVGRALVCRGAAAALLELSPHRRAWRTQYAVR
eukprot:SAG31_NODE_534_length_14370_cov_121.217434_2_plen_88_part_00